ncbi:spermatogenesis-associated protein 1 [Rhinophrynus dorsalis]
MRLKTLRERLGEFLGEDAVLDKFAFLKSVGRSLAVVKAKQEQELKLKSFAPPYALQPELYLLPGADIEGSTYGTSLTSDEYQYSAGYNGLDNSTSSLVSPGTIQLRSPPLNESNKKTPRPDDQEEKEDVDFILNRVGQEAVTNIHVMRYEEQGQSKESQVTPMGKEKILVAAGQNKHYGSSLEDIKKLPERNRTRDSGIPESLGGREIEQSHKKSPKQPLPIDAAKMLTVRLNDQFGDASFRHLSEPAQYLSPPSPPPLPAFSIISPPVPKIPTHRETLVEQLNRLREERIQLEKSREELVKKAKSLLEQQKLKRHRARDYWKKKYFETKKVTSVLEETLNKLRTDLECYYQKLMTHLASRDNRKRTKNPTLATDSKNAVIMEITTKQHELDQLKRKVENARMKLLIEIKMRKQASSDLSALKAELALKKAQASTNLPVFTL